MNDDAPTLQRDLALEPAEVLGPDEVAALFAEVAAATVDPPPPRGVARLRELSTPWRVAIAVGGALLMAAFAVAAMGVRSDLTAGDLARYGLALAGLAGLVGVAFAASLRGAHQRPLGARAWMWIGLALATPIALALVPGLWETGGASMAAGGAMEHAHSPFGVCGWVGLGTGALTAAIAWVFQREGVRVAWRVLAAVGGGGLTAFAILQLHCPSRDATHVLVAHAGAGLLLAGLAVLVVVFARRRP